MNSVTKNNQKVLNKFKECCVPKWNSSLHKGQNGRIGIAGGSKEYAGAPYFASMSSLRTGADLSYILTTEEASPTLKAYSPELIVLPVLESASSKTEIANWMARLHSIVIGPGLGRSQGAFKSVEETIACAKAKQIPIVIDADGLFIVSHNLEQINGYQKCVLTPNMMEFKLLYESCFNKSDDKSSSSENEDRYDEKLIHTSVELQCEAVARLATRLNNLTIIKKGHCDIISNGKQTICTDIKSEVGSPKRCGGIGDILSGTIGTFAHWCVSNGGEEQEVEESLPSLMVACYAASHFVKECSRRAFEKHHRSMLAIDIIEQIGSTFYDIFESK